MNEFLKTYRLALTPLSPIHIGCGEDFEPTNYVIDDGVLYGFDPSRAELNEQQRNDLSQMGSRADLLGIQQFFRDNKQRFKIVADTLIPVATGFAREYQTKLGKVVQRESDRKDVFNKLEIERAMSTGPTRIPFIPGSSFKGVLRTTDLNRINDERPIRYGEDEKKAGSSKLEKRLYEENDFEMSPMRLVKVSDLMPSTEIARSVTYAVMRRKRLVIDRATDEEKQTQDNLATRKEVILHGQYRSLQGSITIPLLGALPDSEKIPRAKLRHLELITLANASNAYYLPKLHDELRILDNRRFASEHWLSTIRALLAGELGSRLKDGKVFLVRLGRYGGAETKTLDGIRSIYIPQAKRQEEKYVKSSHCIWLAASDSKARSDLLPFGWAVVEIDPQGDLPDLKAWCAAQSQGRPDMVAKRREFEAEKLAALQRKAEQQAQTVAREAARLADMAAAEQRAKALASLSAQGQQIEALRQKCADWASRMPPNGNYKKQAPKLGLFQDAAALVKEALASPAWSGNDKLTLADMLEANLSEVVAPWGKDERKLLKISALREAAT